MKNGMMWLTSLLLLAGCSQKDTSKPLFFAHILPARHADDARQGLQLAVEQINKSSDKVLDHKMAVLHVAGSQADHAIDNEIVRLCRVNNVGGIFVQTPMAKVTPVGGVPLLCAWDKPDRDTTETIFHAGLSPAYRGKLLAKLARDAESGLKFDRIGIVAREGHPVKSAFVAEVPAAEIAGSWTFAKTEDLDTVAKDLQGSKAILFLGSADDLKHWLKSATVPVLFGGHTAIAGRFDAADVPDAKVPVYGLSTFWADDDAEATKNFVRDYQEQFKEKPGEMAAAAYEAMQLFKSAFQTAKVLELSKMRKALRSETWNCLSGKLTFDDKGWASRVAYAIKLDQGQATLVTRFAKPDN